MATVCSACYDAQNYKSFISVVPQSTCASCGKQCLGYVVAGDGPQSCYPEEIETLREMLDDIEVASFSVKERERRIKALTTAIEALGGAL